MRSLTKKSLVQEEGGGLTPIQLSTKTPPGTRLQGVFLGVSAMYSKFFLVFFSLFLLLLSGLSERFQKKGNLKNLPARSNRCLVNLTPVANVSSTHFQLAREIVCEK